MKKITIEPRYASNQLLDYLVAICEGKKAIIANGLCQILKDTQSDKENMIDVFERKSYLNSIDGFDIIEREKIDLINGKFGWNVPHFEYGEYTCTLAYGKNMREAGLRRYVSMKLGDSYSIEDEEIIEELEKFGMNNLYQEHCSWLEDGKEKK